MAISIVQQPVSYSFSSTLADTVLTTTADVSVTLTDKTTGTIILAETYVPDLDNYVYIRDLGKVIEGVIDMTALVGTYNLAITDNAGSSFNFDFTVQYGTIEVNVGANIFIAHCFLTSLQGAKTTSLDRKEYLSLKVNTATDITTTATYSQNGVITTTTIIGKTINISDGIVTVDVSPSCFANSYQTLEQYTVTAGARSQTFIVDNISCAGTPSFVFINCFGVKETLTCMGLLDQENKYDGSQFCTNEGQYIKYYTLLVKTFTSNIGIQSQAEAAWVEDIFMSKSVYLYDSSGVGKQITVIDPTVKRSSIATELPSISFTWRYAQENNNILKYKSAASSTLGNRIFDDTFDSTFN